ncbi:alpha-L-fucosidase [Dyadobacter sandarakinus]|uniref:alpha-L-fucosidase n=1 Tax=Dyadobacter sandarakinus TaxID=2747268 RepID=A0ABX7IBA2_9BACT|nr:alpha-L-fucosidase [Dyadobacter sandarakinus]QRR03392.1 alpha-L-fucosidase [Dyadobacter sandarakinus]
MAITITTTTGLHKKYLLDRSNAIYPAFVDNMPYESWSLTEKFEYFQLKATGGTDIKWALAGGQLPPGLKLSADGKITGTPTREGDFNFTVKATSGNDSVTKALGLTAHPYRAKWHAEAKFGAFLTFGPYQYPIRYTKEGIAEFEAEAVKFNAKQWAAQLKAMGAKILNYSAFSTDSIRMWPSKTPTQKELKTKRNYLQELIDACHEQDIKVMVYFSADSIYNDPVDENGKKIPGKSGVNADPSDKSGWGPRNTGLVTELSLMNIDGFWFDVGASDPALYPKGAIEPDFFRWKINAPIMRHNNPWHIIGVNPGTAAMGNLWQYPLIDYTIFEGRAYTLLETTLVDGFRPKTKKKMSAEALNLLDTIYTIKKKSEMEDTQFKPAEMIIRSIKRNWAAGATFILNWPTLPDGTMIPPVYKDVLKTIGDFVKANRGKATPPPTAVAANARQAAPTATRNSLTSFIKSPVSGDSPAKEANDYYRGMVFVVGDKPLQLYQVGRKGTKPGADKNLIIKKYWNNYPVLSETFKGDSKTFVNGYQYTDLDPIQLDAGMVYYIGIQENEREDYASSTFDQLPKTEHIRITGNMILNANGDITPVKKDNFGQIIDLKFKVLPSKTGDIALGKPINFQSHVPPYKELGPNAVVLYAFNMNDGDPDSAGGASGDYQWVSAIDLLYVRKITKVVVKFHRQGFATEMKLTTGLTKNQFNETAVIKDNESKTITYHIKPTEAQFVHLWIVKPDGPNQKGSGVTIASIEVY